MDTIAVYCKGCGTLFYATSRIIPNDVLEIAELAKMGHRVAKVDDVEVRNNLARCSCPGGIDG